MDIIGWLISLLLTLVMSAGAAVPGTIEGRLDTALTDALRARVSPDATVSTHVTGDPFLQLPWGIVPRVDAHILGLRSGPVAIAAVDVTLSDLRLPPGVLAGHVPRELLTPVNARVAAQVRAADLQAALDALLGMGALKDLKSPLPLLGRSLSVEGPRVRMEDGRLLLDATLVVQPGGRRVPVAVTAEPVIVDGRQIVAATPRVTIGGRDLPASLVGWLAHQMPPLFSMAQVPMPAGDWRFTDIAVASGTLTLTVTGRLEPSMRW